MSNKLALCALLLVAFVFSASLSVDAQKRKVNVAATLIETAPAETLLPEASPAADIDQCQNGQVGPPTINVDCGSGWSNGNANGNNSHYQEGAYIHYRIKFSNLVDGNTYQVLIGYDVLKGTKHAIDYLGTYNADFRFDPSPTLGYNVDPCYNIAGCSGDTPDTLPIDRDPLIPGSIFVDSGVFTMWGGDLISMEYDPTSNTGEERRIILTFKAESANPVLAWGGHIAWQGDWGANATASTAGDINGAPYHMRIVKNDYFTGQQDRSLQVSAITTTTPSAAPATITGRVTDRYGRGIYGARVQLFDASTGAATVAVTNTFGYYRFSDVAVGDAYVMSVYHSRYIFVNGSTSFSLEADLAGVNFVAN